MDLTLYDHLQTPVLAVDRNLNTVYFNHICAAWFQTPPRKLRGAALPELIRTTQADLKALCMEAFKENAPKFTKEFVAETGEGDAERALVVKAFPLGNGLLAVNVHDTSIEKQLHEKYKKQILELKETHEQIVRSDKLTALGELIAGISHEIATPLTIISDRLEQLGRAIGTSDLGAAREVHADLQAQFKRVGKVVSGMQSNAGDREERASVCDLSQVASEAISFARDLNLLQNIEIEEPQRGAFLTLGNPVKLQQVLVNLIKNSSDAFKESGQNERRVGVSLVESPEEQSHILKVWDNGPGIGPQAREKVFEMFFTSKEAGEGTGLGLNISQKIVEAHNGRIELEDGENGCCFALYLPILEVAAFTATNRYLRGESETEDEKILVAGESAEQLDQAYQALAGREKVLVLSSKRKGLEEVRDFFGIERALVLDSRDLSFLGLPAENIAGLAGEDLARKLGGA